MPSFFRGAAPRAFGRRTISFWPRRRIAGEQLELRTLLSANLSFAVAGPNGDQGLAVATDTSGNIYELATDAVYKFSAGGAFVWSTPYTASSGINQKEGIAVDGSGDVYIAGNFGNNSGSPAVFGSTSLVSAGGNDGYLAKLGPNGSFLWAQSFGGTGDDTAYAVALDSSGDPYVTGHFSGQATIGTGTTAKTLLGNGSNQAILVAKFDPSGALKWANAYSNTSGDEGRGIAVDSQGNAYVTGEYSGTLDFDPAQPNANKLTSFFSSAFVLKLDEFGDFIWVKQLGTNNSAGDGRAEGDAIAVDSAGNVYSTGIFGGPVDLDPNLGDLNTSADFVFPDAYVLKLGPAGNFDWAADLHGVSVTNPFGGLQASGIAVDSQGIVYTTGGYSGIANFDPAGTHQQTSAGGQDVYVSALTAQGKFDWVATAGETGTDEAFGVAVAPDASGTAVYTVGTFSNTMNFNSGVGPVDNLTSPTPWDGFLWGLNTLPTEIAGVVWNDQNGDGVRQSSEPGVPGISVGLYYGTPGSGTQVASTVTDPLGLYSFSGLAIGKNYYVQVTPPSADAFSPEGAGTDPTLASNVSPATGTGNTISVSAGQTLIANAGLRTVVVTPTVNLALGIPTLGFTEGSSVLADGAGDMYVAGSFDGKTLLGSGSNTTTFNTGAPNDFIAKYAANGTLLWARQIVSGFTEEPPKLAFDGAGNIYLAGELSGDATFGTNVVAVPTVGNTAFLAKMNASGSFLWATAVANNAVSENVGLAVDSLGNSYVVGGYSKSVTVATTPATTLTSLGNDDVFAVKYSTSGAAQWAKSFGGLSDDAADSAAIDPSGNPVLTGWFGSTAQFGSTSLRSNSQFKNDFVAKLNEADGTVIWAQAITSTISSGPQGDGAITPSSRIAVDPQGNIYTTGTFDGTLQLDPTNGTDAVNGANATFISKLDNNGNFVWGKAYSIGNGGYNVEGMGIAVDSKGDVFTTGDFAGTINFNPNSGPAQNLTANGASYDIYISELDSNGNYINVQQFGGPDEDQGTADYVDAKGNVYATGVSIGPSQFGTLIVGATDEQDDFLVRLGNVANSVVNVAPSFTLQGPQQSVALNAPAQVVPGFVTNIFPGALAETNEIATFVLTDDNPNLFSVAPSIDANGTLTYTPAPNMGGTANITVALRNDGGTANGGSDTSPTQTFTITVGVNHAPTFTVGANQSVNENTGFHSVTGWARNVIPGPADEASQTLTFLVTYQVVNGGADVMNGTNSLFAVPPSIDPLTGNLTFTTTPDEYGTAQVSVQLQDDGGTAFGGQDTSVLESFIITVNLVNHAPSFTAGADQTVDENSGAQSVAGWATAISAGPPSEAAQTLHFNVTTDNNALFAVLPAIDPTTGTLTYTLAHDVSGVANVSVKLQDNGGTTNGGSDTSTAQTFTITANFVNQPPMFASQGDVEVLENSGDDDVPGWASNISAGDAQEASQVLTFNVTNNSNPGLFSSPPTIDPTTGDLSFTPATDMWGIATITVELDDDGGTANGGQDASVAETFTITVDLVNHAPSFTAGGDQVVNENSGTQTVPGWAASMSAGPPSESYQTLNFVVATDNPDLFPTPPEIDPITGDLIFTPATDVSGVANVSVELMDNGGTDDGGNDTSAVQTFTITVNFVNQAPVFTAGSDQTVHETPGPQTVTGWATNISAGAPQESDQNLNFIVSTDNDSLFSLPPAIDPTTGNLTYTPALYAVGTAHVTVKLHDDGGTVNGGIDTSTAQTFTITVTQSNQAPTFASQGDVSMAGSFGAVTVPGWATNISPGPANEARQALNFEVGTDNSALFAVAPTIDPTTGNLTFTPTPQMSGQANVTVMLHDNGGTANGGVDTSAPVTFLLTITFVNQAPTFAAGSDQTILENAGSQTVAGWATAMSAGPPDESAQTLSFITSTDNDSLFSVLPAIDPVTGKLTYTPAIDANGVAHVAVRLHDNGGTANGGQDTSAAQTLTITVTPVNQPPLFTSGATVNVLQNAGLTTVTGWATGISPGAPNEASQKLNFEVSTNDPSFFTTLPSIDPATGNLTFTTAPEAVGTATVSLDLHDNGGTANGGIDTSATQSFTIAVAPVNQPPVFIAGANQTVSEDAGPQTVTGWATGIGPGGGPNEAGQSVNFIVKSDNPGLFSSFPQIDPATGDLTYTVALKSAGTAHVSVQLHDNGGTLNGGIDTSAPQTFTITSQFVNTAPSFTLAGNPPATSENGGIQTVYNFATHISPASSAPSAAIEANQTVHFNVTSDSNAALFSTPPAITPGGTLTYTAATGVSGSATVTVTLQDNGGAANGGVDTSAPQSFTITVNPLNPAPIITHVGTNPIVDEDSGTASISGFIAATPGAAGEPIDYKVTTDDTDLFTATGRPTIDSAGTLSFTPALHAVGTTTVDVTATAGGSQPSATIKFFVEVNPTDHAPTLANALGTVNVNENAADVVFGSLASVFDDVDVDLQLGDHLTLSVAGNDNPSLVSASLSSGNPDTSKLTLHVLPDEFGTAHIDLRATDISGETADDTITVNVDQVNQPPTFTPGGDVHVAVNSPSQSVAWATNISPGPSQPHETVDFSVSVDSLTNPGLFSISPAIDASGNLTFTPAAGQTGKATMTVSLQNNGGTANGGSDTSAPVTFTIDVDVPPVAINHSYIVSSAASSSASAAAGVLVGDIAASGLGLSAKIVTQPTNGTLQLNADGSFSYTPGPTFEGVDSFTYDVSDGLSTSNIATVTLSSDAAAVISKLYQQVLNRAPDAAGLEYWVNLIQQGQPYSVVAQGIFESPERLDPIIDSYYQQFLLRPADAAGVAYWTGVWTSFGGPEPVVAGMISSAEFYASAGQARPDLSPNQAWVTALYQRLLDRQPDQTGLAYWSGQLDSGAMTRTQVVDGFNSSVEYYENVTTSIFEQYLGRSPTAGELANYVSALQMGATQRTIQIELIDSAEYQQTPTPPAAGGVTRLS
ncbi:MAG TPA: DUF4214 domain-containing protein [Pirellulales bacterium]|nr:DUF4214 domain-containing protein [Pirellulales bacterium]